MATATMAYGERRFGTAYTARVFLSLGVLGLLIGLWIDDPNFSAHPQLTWISIGLVAGVRHESAFGQQEMAWSQIAETRYRVVPIHIYGHFGLIGALIAMSSKSGRAQLTLTLISNDGKKLKVTSNYRNASEAIGLILGKILPPKVQSVKARLQRGETVPFGGIGLSATAVTWKKNSIPLSELTKAELVRGNLQLKRQGKWLTAISVRSDKVPDVLAFFEVLESLAPQVKSTGIDPLTRVRM